MDIGPIRTRGRFFLAPMAGFTNSSMRQLCVEHGAGLVYSEMIVASQLVRDTRGQRWMVRFEEVERPIIAQMAAAEPESAARATCLLAEMGFDALDLNLGCAIDRIVAAGMGAALAAGPRRVRTVLQAMVQASSLPVTVKMRLGPDAGHETAPALAKLCEEAGCAAVAVHGRTAEQGYEGEADWSAIARVKKAVRIPVIGSGSVRTAGDAVAMLRQTGCDAVMIARGALGNPWIFRRASQLLATASAPGRPGVAEVRRAMLRHYELLLAEKGRHHANQQLRKQAPYYARHLSRPDGLLHALDDAAIDEDLARIIRRCVG